jgi:hypothetical protein
MKVKVGTIDKMSFLNKIIAIFSYFTLLYLFFALDPSFGSAVTPGGDVGYDAGWIHEMSRDKIPVTFGGSGVFGMGHPGPLYLWLATIGYMLGGYLGWYVIWVAASLFLWVLAGYLISVKYSNPLPLCGILLGYILADLHNGYDGIALDWTEDSPFAQSLLLVAISGVILSSRRWSGMLMIVFGVFSVTVWANLFFIALPIIIYGIIFQKRNWRTSKGIPRQILIGAISLVTLTFFARWYLYGAAFPIEYVEAIINFRTNEPAGSPAEVMNLFVSGMWWGLPETLSWSLWALVISVAIIFTIIKKSIVGFILSITAFTASVTAILVPTMSETHIVSVVGLIPPLSLAIIFGVLGAFLARNKFGSISVGVITVMLLIFSLDIFNGDPTNKVRYSDAMQSITSTAGLILSLEQNEKFRETKGKSIRVMLDPNDKYQPYYEVGLKNSLLVELHRRGYRVCRDFPTYNPGKGGSVSKTMNCSSLENRPEFDLVFTFETVSDGSELAVAESFDKYLKENVRVNFRNNDNWELTS